MLNKILLCGRLISPPTMRNNYARATLSITEEFQDKEGKTRSMTHHHPISIGGRVAESFAIHAKQDDIVMIEGKLVRDVVNSSNSLEYRVFVQSYKIMGHQPQHGDEETMILRKISEIS